MLLLDRSIPLAPTLAVLLTAAAVSLVIADRRAVARSDRAALLQLAAIELGHKAALAVRA